MSTSDELNAAMKKIEDDLGEHKGALFNELVKLSVSGQPCDVTLESRKPFLDVTIDPEFVNVIMYSKDSKKREEVFSEIKLMQGGWAIGSVAFNDIWTLNPMPYGGVSQEKLDGVDVEEVTKGMGEHGETLRRMIKETYHCKDKVEEEYYLKRFIAS